MGEIDYNRYSLQRGLAWIRTCKKEYVLRCVKRIVAFWTENPATGIKAWIWNSYQIPLLVSAVIGLWRNRHRNPVAAFCLAMLLVVPWVYYLTGVADGHRLCLPFDAVLTIFASSILTLSLMRRTNQDR